VVIVAPRITSCKAVSFIEVMLYRKYEWVIFEFACASVSKRASSYKTIHMKMSLISMMKMNMQGQKATIGNLNARDNKMPKKLYFVQSVSISMVIGETG